MVVSIDTEPTFSPGNPEILFEMGFFRGPRLRGRPFDISDGERFLMIKAGAPTEEVTLRSPLAPSPRSE